jgi:carboxyl-terminal processing protease
MRGRLTIAFGFAVIQASAIAHAAALAPLQPGIWRTDGYGYIFKSGDGKLTIFDETKSACVFNGLLEGPEAGDYIGTAEPGPNPSQAILHAGITRIAVTRLAALPERCTPSDPDPDPGRNFDVLWSTFDEQYAFFAARNVDWNALRREFRPKAVAARTPDELFDAISKMLARLKDAHVQLTAGEKQFQAERSPAPTAPDADGMTPTRKALQKGLKDYITGPSTPLLNPAAATGRNRVWYGRTSQNTGYIAVFAMGGFEEDDVTSEDHAASARKIFQEIAGKLAGVSGVVVDLRYNQGGFDTVSLALVGLFADRPGTAFKKSAHGAVLKPYSVALIPAAPARLEVPVAVLISEHTVSAGETAAAAFRTLPNAKLFGQPTQGALSDTLSKALPNGWTFTLSNEIFTTADGTSPEVVGVTPHVELPSRNPATASQRFRPDINEAVRWLNAASGKK